MSSEAYPGLDANKPEDLYAESRGVAKPAAISQVMHFEGLITRNSEGRIVEATEGGVTVTPAESPCTAGCLYYVHHDMDM